MPDMNLIAEDSFLMSLVQIKYAMTLVFDGHMTWSNLYMDEWDILYPIAETKF